MTIKKDNILVKKLTFLINYRLDKKPPPASTFFQRKRICGMNQCRSVREASMRNKTKSRIVKPHNDEPP